MEPQFAGGVLVETACWRALMERQRFIVDAAGKDWCVMREGQSAPVGRFPTKRQAINRGRQIARSHGYSQLIVKSKAHVIQAEWTYDEDPRRFPG
jgi:hypothetical protein